MKAENAQLIALSFFAFLIVTSISSAAPAGCKVNADCKHGRICVNEICTRPEATPDTDSVCEADKDCSGTLICVNGACTVDKGLESPPTSIASTTPSTPSQRVGFGPHKMTVVTDVPGVNVSVDSRGGWFPTPREFFVNPGPHLVTIDALGYVKQTIPVDIRDSDVTVSVDTNRPVFSTGLFFAILGLAGTVTCGITKAVKSAGQDGLSVSIAAGATVFVGGVLMMAFDGVDKPNIKITSMGHSPAAQTPSAL